MKREELGKAGDQPFSIPGSSGFSVGAAARFLSRGGRDRTQPTV
jgi:hypothetical protein